MGRRMTNFSAFSTRGATYSFDKTRRLSAHREVPARIRRTFGFLLLTASSSIVTTGMFAASEERDARAAGPHYKRVCDANAANQPVCHAWMLVDDNDQP